MNHCPECGATLVNAAVYCGSCGHRVASRASLLDRLRPPYPTRAWVTALVVVVVASVAVAGGVFWAQDRPPAARWASGPSSAAPADPLTAGQAETIVADLTSGDPVRARAAIAMPPEAELDVTAIEQLATLDLSIDIATFVVEPDGMATAAGTVTDANGRHPATFIFALVEGRWLFVDARPSDGGR